MAQNGCARPRLHVYYYLLMKALSGADYHFITLLANIRIKINGENNGKRIILYILFHNACYHGHLRDAPQLSDR